MSIIVRRGLMKSPIIRISQFDLNMSCHNVSSCGGTHQPQGSRLSRETVVLEETDRPKFET